MIHLKPKMLQSAMLRVYFTVVFFRKKESGPFASGPFLPDLLLPDISYPGPFVAGPFTAGPFEEGRFVGVSLKEQDERCVNFFSVFVFI
jgi:hypothetical protein